MKRIYSPQPLKERVFFPIGVGTSSTEALLRKWMQKLVEQLELDVKPASDKDTPHLDMTEERATLLYFIDTYNKYLFEVDSQPIRRVREAFDEFAKNLIHPNPDKQEKMMFRLRHFFSSYRIDEFTYLQKTFDDFRGIIWDFVDQLAEDLSFEQGIDKQVQQSLEQLKEAVESNSIHDLKSQSRQFIDSYIEFQTRKESRRSRRLEAFRKSLDSVKKQLVEANNSMKVDHLTKAFNRKTFEEQAKNYLNLFKIYNKPVSMILADIDYFKRINDVYGHPIGDFVLQEFVKILKEIFTRDIDVVARVGGEEFGILLPDYQIEHAEKKAEEALKKIRAEVFVQEDMQIRFTISMGLAQLKQDETVEMWMKRADQALYESKHAGRDRFTVAEKMLTKKESA